MADYHRGHNHSPYSQDHDHAHDHDHGQGCCHDHDHDHNGHPDAMTTVPLTENASNEMIIASLFNAVRYGLKTQAKSLLEANPSVVNMFDPSGHSLAHFAAKRGDIETLQLLVDHGARLNLPATSEAKMCPVHWAASEGKLAALRFFLDKRQDMNAQDSNGCTPLVIAAQHNQPMVAAFLVKNGADLTIRDCNGDTALHWAAYTGHLEVLGLLAHCMPHFLNAEDNFGQTPLHLAAMKGHTGVVEYLLMDCNVEWNRKDRNGLTAIDVAMKKGQLNAEWAIRRHTTSNIIELLRGLSVQRLKSKRIWSMALFGANEKEISNWPWRVVFCSNLFASVTSVTFALNPILLDLSSLHVFNLIVQVMWWIFFPMCLYKSPSLVRDENSADAKQRGVTYDSILERIGNSNGDEEFLQVCHSCHVCRPIRSKHCKILRRCVNKFDHYCPFVGNAVGRDNYKYFVGLLFVHILCASGWEVTVSYLWARDTISWGMMCYMVYAFAWLIMVCFLFHYHVLLITQNLTTNEHINMSKYAYMKNQYNMMDNPFDLHSTSKNIIDGLFPIAKQLYTRLDALQLRNSRSDFDANLAEESKGLLERPIANEV